tara:strand:+ start:20370 stop:20774 length:405 start_codon:yes stop_codon:yes gene_type:complete
MTKVELQNGQFVDLINGLFAVQNLKGVKFGLLVSKNIRVLQEELDHLEIAARPSNEFVELSTQVNALMAEDKADEIKKLEEKNAKLVEARKAQLTELEELLKEDTKISLYSIPEDCLPEDITGEQIINIDKIIE